MKRHIILFIISVFLVSCGARKMQTSRSAFQELSFDTSFVKKQIHNYMSDNSSTMKITMTSETHIQEIRDSGGTVIAPSRIQRDIAEMSFAQTDIRAKAVIDSDSIGKRMSYFWTADEHVNKERESTSAPWVIWGIAVILLIILILWIWMRLSK